MSAFHLASVRLVYQIHSYAIVSYLIPIFSLFSHIIFNTNLQYSLASFTLKFDE